MTSIVVAVLLVLCLVCTQAFIPKTGMVRPLARGISMEFEWKSFKKTQEERMAKSLESVQSQYNTLRAGGANPAILDRVLVDYYGSLTPLNQVARVQAQGAQMIIVEPFDKTLVVECEKAIATSNLNLNPTNDGNMLRINIPPLTEERRKDLVKQAKGILEEGKISIRNGRRDGMEAIKKAEKAKECDKDDSKFFQDELQKVTDDFVKKLDAMFKKKEGDLLKV